MTRLVEIFQDIDGQLSSKRVMAFLALGGYFMAGIADAMGHAVGTELVSGLRDIAVGGIALSVPERFGAVKAGPGPDPKPDVPA